MTESIAIFGGGKIGEALLTGLLRGSHEPTQIVVVEKNAPRAQYLTKTLAFPWWTCPPRHGPTRFLSPFGW
jgi:pyrroline-5-carboxylate reductase